MVSTIAMMVLTKKIVQS